jgi:pimeloyl-ACP methyl ester carboxylesterase
MTNDRRTIFLIHGLWMTPRSWEPFHRHYAEHGHPVVAPPWPGLQGEVEDVRRDPSPLNGLGVTQIVDHYERVIRLLDEPPIIMGHSFGGLYVQLLLDRGLGAAGVAIDAAAPKGVLKLPPSQARSLWPVLKNPANRKRTVALTFKQFQYAFANNMSEADARAAYDLNAIPGPGRPVFQAGFAALAPHGATKVNYRNDKRAPLLFIAGGQDHIVPPAVNRANHHKYRHSKAVTAFKEFPGRSHLIVAQAGWEEVADHALSWSLAQIEAAGSTRTTALERPA